MKTRIKWNRLLVNPRTRVVDQDAAITHLQVDGLVCSTVCALRTKQALERLDGVDRVRVDFDTGLATIEGRLHAAAAYERAVTNAVAGKPLRRLIEHAASWAHRRRPDPASNR